MAIDFHKWQSEEIATIHEPDGDDCAHATSSLNRAVLTQLGVARHAVSPPLHDIINMLQFFIQYGLPRNHEALRKIHPDLMTFEKWLLKTGWRGESGEVQKDPMTGSK